MSTSEHADNVNGGINSDTRNGCDFLWGVQAIGQVIGRSSRQTFHILSKGEIKSAKKIGGRWMVSRAALLKELGA